MRRGMLIGVAVVVGVLGGIRSARADIIVDQPPNLTGGPASDTDYVNYLGQPFWQREVDNMLLAQAADISRVVWYGFYGGDGTPATPPPTPENIQIRFMGARPGDGLPDENGVVFDQTYVNPSRGPTGRILAGVGGHPAEQVYQVDFPTPIHLLGSTGYWIEIVQLGDVNSMFRWEAGSGVLTGHAFTNPLSGGWFATGGSLAFQLSDVPEPGTGALLSLGILTLGKCRGRREATRSE